MNVTLHDLLAVLASGGMGWLVALVTFRTRMAALEWRAAALEKQAAGLAKAVDRIERAFNAIERRQLVQLQLSADIARKMGISHRLPEDLLVRLLTEEDSQQEGD